MRRTIHAATLTLALLTSGALAQVTYLALEPHPTLEAAEAQAALLDAHPTTVITETSPVPGYESINLQRHTYRVLVGPLNDAQLAAARHALEAHGHQPELTTLATEIRDAYQVQIGSYRSQELARDARAALEALGEPGFTIDARPFTFVHAGPYDTRQEAEAALARIQATGITTLPVLGTLTPEHRTTLDQQNQPTTQAEAVEAPLTQAADLPIPVPTPTPAVDATPEPRELQVDATAELPEPQPLPTPQATAELNDTPDLTAVAEAAAEVAQEIREQVAEAAERVAEAIADETARQRLVYVHVASGKTAAQFDAPLAALQELEHEPQVRRSGDRYRLYVGPIPAYQADELRQALRQHGIASFTTDQTSGETATLPAPEEEPVTLAEAPTEEPHEEDALGVEEALATAKDQEPTPEATASETGETPEATAEEAVAEEPTWEPDTPILASRAELEPTGVYLTARTGPLHQHQEAFEELTAAGFEPVFLTAGEQVILLVGPVAEWEEAELRAELRRNGMPAITAHHPAYTPQTTLIAAAADAATTPSNYLALAPLEGITLEDLTSAAPDLILVNGTPLVGPIPNEDLPSAAKPLTRLATVTFHPYPAAPEGGTPDEWTQHAYDLLAHQQAEAARQAFLEARALDPTHYDALFGLAVTEDELGNQSAADFAYQYVMGAHPQRFEARFNYALRTQALEGPQAAIQHYQQALALAQGHPASTRAQAHAALAGALALVNDHHGAAEQYDAAHQLTNDLDHLVARIKAQRATGRSLDLLPELTQHELETRDARFTALIADIYTQADQPAYAIDAINRRMRDDLTPNEHALLLNARAATHATTGEQQQALEDLTAAYALTPQDATTRHNLGLALLSHGDPEGALPHLQAAVELGVTDPQARLDLAEAAYRAGDQAAALEHAKAAAPALNGEARYRALLIHAQTAQAQWEYLDSIASLEELLTVTPNDAHLLTMAGTAYYQTGQYARAAERLEAAHNITGDPIVQEALVNAYLASQRYGDAERALRATLATHPDDADALHKLGWALLHLGNHQGAKTAWNDATALHHPQAATDLKTVFQ